ncbi:MAG: hypothetical protein WEB89_05210 [Balneolales bacterium]
MHREKNGSLTSEIVHADMLADLQASRNIHIEDCNRVCLALGPYRNLTTLTASALFLHPNCQVLNHARDRIFNAPDINFLSSYSQVRFNNFIKYAILISGKGERGKHGGSITFSHAFDPQHEMADIFQKTGLNLIKNKINCLFWKESLTISNHIRDHLENLETMLYQEQRLVFLLPIRNPLDCAISNLHSGHASRFRIENSQQSIHTCILAILDEINWFLSHQEKYSDRFFHYFAHTIDKDMLKTLANFLILSHDEEWIANALRVMVVKSSYEHEDSILQFYRKSVEIIFAGKPWAQQQLLKFIPR